LSDTIERKISVEEIETENAKIFAVYACQKQIGLQMLFWPESGALCGAPGAFRLSNSLKRFMWTT